MGVQDQKVAKLKWHHFGRKINWFGPQKKKRELKSRAHDLKNQNNNKFLVLKV
jgi:hypothetical protein